MENNELTEEVKQRIYKEIARLSFYIDTEECMGCIKSLAQVINGLAAVLANKITVKLFLETIVERQAGHKMVQFYLDLFDI